MKKLIIAASAGAMLLAGAGVASAQRYDNNDRHNDAGHHDGGQGGWNNNGHHDGGQGGWNNSGHNNGGQSGWNNSWRRGARIDNDHWSQGSRLDWRSHHLRHPPRGYEWRYVDGRYVMAAVATGIIADIILNSR